MQGIKDQFVTYEIALGLKELGFDEECFAIFFRTILNNGRTVNYISDDWESPFYKNRTNSESNSVDIVSAPLWQQVIDWLREKYGIYILIMPCRIPSNEIKYYIFKGKLKWDRNELYNTYEEAREQAILKCIELCQNKK